MNDPHVLTDEEIRKISRETGFCFDDVLMIYDELTNYMYFPSKQDVLAECIRVLYTGRLHENEQIDSYYDDPDEPDWDRLEAEFYGV